MLQYRGEKWDRNYAWLFWNWSFGLCRSLKLQERKRCQWLFQIQSVCHIQRMRKAHVSGVSWTGNKIIRSLSVWGSDTSKIEPYSILQVSMFPVHFMGYNKTKQKTQLFYYISFIITLKLISSFLYSYLLDSKLLNTAEKIFGQGSTEKILWHTWGPHTILKMEKR